MDSAKLYNDLRWNLTRPQGLEGVMRVRCSNVCAFLFHDYFLFIDVAGRMFSVDSPVRVLLLNVVRYTFTLYYVLPSFLRI